MKNNSENNKKSTDPFDIKKFKKGIAYVESSGGKYLWNKTSTATGKYQFLYSKIKDLRIMKGITRKQFMNNPDLQEKVMDMALKGKLKDRPGYFKNAKDLTEEYSQRLGGKWNFRKDEVAAISHFLGRQGARNYFNSVLSGKEYQVAGKVNLKVNEYLDKYNSAIGSKRGFNKQEEPVSRKKLSFNNQSKNNDLKIKPFEQSFQKKDITNIPLKDNLTFNNFSNKQFQTFQPKQPKLQKKQQFQQPQQQTQAQFLEQYLGSNEFSLGGGLNNNNMNLFNEGGDLLTEFNNGGTHEENPMGGIPQGMGQNGKPNLVEEGETKVEDYVFSDRIVLNKEVVKQFNLPNNLANKTIAEASKVINSYSKESNNIIDKETTKENLERLKSANELLKEINQMQNPQEQNQFDGGGFMNFMNENGSKIGGAASGAMGIINGFSGKDGNTDAVSGGLSGAANGAMAGMQFGPWGAAIGGVLGGVSGVVGAGAAKRRELRQNNTDTSAHFNNVNNQFGLGGLTNPDPTYPQDPNELISSFKSNKEGLSYQNPYPNRSNRGNTFNAYQNNLKRKAGGSSGGNLSKNNVLNKAGENATVTFNGTSMTGKEINNTLNKRNQLKGQDDFFIKEVFENNYANKFNDGGVIGNKLYGGLQMNDVSNPLKMYSQNNNINIDLNDRNSVIGLQKKLGMKNTDGYYGKNTHNALKSSFDTNLQTRKIDPRKGSNGVLNSIRSNEIGLNFEEASSNLLNQKQKLGVPYSDSFLQLDENVNTNKEKALNEAKKWSNPNANEKELPKFDFGKFGTDMGEALRYAPAAMNAYQLATLNKPEEERLNTLDKRYKPDYVDEAQLVNQANEQYAGTAERIANASNGSQGALRASLLGAQLNKDKGLSQSFMQAENINRQQNDRAQQFNLGVDQFNIQQDTRQKDMNARNRGAYETNKSRLMGQLGNDLGNIGLENLRKKYPELMGMDYDTLGKFIQLASKTKK